MPRCIGNVVIEWQGRGGGINVGNGERAPVASAASAGPTGQTTLVGFENHGGRTFLAAGARPLGRVLSGFGNNAQDGTEGAVVRNAFGTYLHGSLLPKNPHFADHLLRLALARRHPHETLAPLDDTLEWRAHQTILRRQLRTV